MPAHPLMRRTSHPPCQIPGHCEGQVPRQAGAQTMYPLAGGI
ncbi:MAG: hypothetical protein Metus_0712 [Candidatus Methanosuratincola subterraneus]|uniref:Uncharacterized protein n=1 Tax=Methanosuratincola subterraneus TaxID=2593994 RepID=A0A444L8M9_METS7|nr:MAG: hypothetical protein Metus_0712 [Candidatus Methanosuratincola subterraneus]